MRPHLIVALASVTALVAAGLALLIVGPREALLLLLVVVQAVILALLVIIKANSLPRADANRLSRDLRAVARASLASTERLEATTTAINDHLSAAGEAVENRVARRFDHHVRHVEGLFQLYTGGGSAGHAVAMPLTGGWAIDPANLSAALDVIERRRPRLVLELGSGTSTVWVGRLLRDLGTGRVITVDHLAKYANATRAAVERLGVSEQVDIRLVDLVPTGLKGHQTPWYDVSKLADIEQIDVMLVDGPPARTGQLARYPALPLFGDRMSDDAMIMVDDATRPDEVEMIERWKREMPWLREEISVPAATLRILRKASTVASWR